MYFGPFGRGRGEICRQAAWGGWYSFSLAPGLWRLSDGLPAGEGHRDRQKPAAQPVPPPAGGQDALLP